MLMDIHVSPAAIDQIPTIMRTLRMVYDHDPGAEIRHRRIRGEHWILVDVPAVAEDNVTMKYTMSNGFEFVMSGVAR